MKMVNNAPGDRLPLPHQPLFELSVNSLLNSKVSKGNTPGTSVCVETYPRAGPSAADYGPGNKKVFFIYKTVHNSLFACLFFFGSRCKSLHSTVCGDLIFGCCLDWGSNTYTFITPSYNALHNPQPTHHHHHHRHDITSL